MKRPQINQLTSNFHGRKFTSDEINLMVAMMEFAADNGFWDEGSEEEIAAWEELLGEAK